MEAECKQCNKVFKRPRKTSKFCSRECQQKSLVKSTNRVCENRMCGLVFEARPHEARKYCSRSCAATVNNALSPKRGLEGSCRGCGKPIPASRIRCKPCHEERPKTPVNQEDVNRYMRVRYRSTYPKMRSKALEELGGACVRCGTDDGLEFDHVDPRSKKVEVTNMLDTHSWETIKEELRKCQLLCKPCHRDKTREDYAEGLIKVWNAPEERI